MGDDELNFTEEEARGWANDPRNQIQDWTACEQALAFSAVLVIAALILIWLASIPVQQPAAPGPVPAAAAGWTIVPAAVLSAEASESTPARPPFDHPAAGPAPDRPVALAARSAAPPAGPRLRRRVPERALETLLPPRGRKGAT